MVEMASMTWNILLCRQSEDKEATRCGVNGLTRFDNGTLAVQGPPLQHGLGGVEGSGVDGAREGGEPIVKMNKYANYMVDDMLAAQKERVPVVEAMIYHAIASGELLHPMGASSLLRQLQRKWPETMWNVLIEKNSGAHIYFCEEQFNFEVFGIKLSATTRNDGVQPKAIAIAIFDRQCYTLEQEQKKLENERATRI